MHQVHECDSESNTDCEQVMENLKSASFSENNFKQDGVSKNSQNPTQSRVDAPQSPSYALLLQLVCMWVDALSCFRLRLYSHLHNTSQLYTQSTHNTHTQWSTNTSTTLPCPVPVSERRQEGFNIGESSDLARVSGYQVSGIRYQVSGWQHVL